MNQRTSKAQRAITLSEIRPLTIDIGRTGLKASVLDGAGKMSVDEVRVAAPYPCPPKVLLKALADLASSLPSFQPISVGFPGVVRDGQVLTAPHFGDEPWCDFPLIAAWRARAGSLRLACSNSCTARCC
jgi:predicted NBD/HSP70 family sugar kinase